MRNNDKTLQLEVIANQLTTAHDAEIVPLSHHESLHGNDDEDEPFALPDSDPPFRWEKADGFAILNGVNEWRSIVVRGVANPEAIRGLLNELDLPDDYEWSIPNGDTVAIFFRSDGSIGRPVEELRSEPKASAGFERIELRWEQRHTAFPSTAAAKLATSATGPPATLKPADIIRALKAVTGDTAPLTDLAIEAQRHEAKWDGDPGTVESALKALTTQLEGNRESDEFALHLREAVRHGLKPEEAEKLIESHLPHVPDYGNAEPDNPDADRKAGSIDRIGVLFAEAKKMGWDSPWKIKGAVAPDTKPTPRTKLPFRTAEDIARAGVPETDYLIEDLVPKGSVVLLSGVAKGAGKTTFAVHAIRALTNGAAFLGRDTEQSSVAYLTEQDENSFLNEYLNPAGVDNCPDLHIVHGYQVAELRWPELAKAAIRDTVEIGADVLVIDTFAYFSGFDGEEENNSADVQRAFKPLQDAAAEHGITIIVVHHDRKSGGDVHSSTRGSSAFQAAVDLILNLRRRQGGHSANARELRTAGRYSAIPKRLTIRLTEQGYISLGTSPDSASASMREMLKRVAPSSEENALTRNELLDAVNEIDPGASKKTLEQEVKSLAEKGALAQLGKGVRGDPYRYYQQ